MDSAAAEGAAGLVADLHRGGCPRDTRSCDWRKSRTTWRRPVFSGFGGLDDKAVFYYRIQSPVVLIEFDHLSGIAFDNEEPTRNHIHTVVRTPNGGDYGKDLLRQHYARHHAHGA